MYLDPVQVFFIISTALTNLLNNLVIWTLMTNVYRWRTAVPSPAPSSHAPAPRRILVNLACFGAVLGPIVKPGDLALGFRYVVRGQEQEQEQE